MFLTNNGTIPDYYSLYQMAKPIYAYYSSLTHLVEKSEKHTVIMSEREITLLLALIERITNLKAHLPSLEESFCIARFFEMRKLIVMTRPQLQAKKRLFSIIKLTNINDSIAYLAQLLDVRIQTIKTLEQPYFALPIPSTCLKIGLQLLFSPYTESKIRELGSGTFGVVDQVACMGQVCAKKTVLAGNENAIKPLKLGARTGILMASPFISSPYHEGDQTLYSESGIIDCHNLQKTTSSLEAFIVALSIHVEDLLIGLSTLHLGLKKIRRCYVIKQPFPGKCPSQFKVLISYHYLPGTFLPPIVHGDFKSSNCVLFEKTSQRRRTVKIIDLDTVRPHGRMISHIPGAYGHISPEAARIYKNPRFIRQVSIYDDSWSLGCSIYQFIFGKMLYSHDLKSKADFMSYVETFTQETIHTKLKEPVCNLYGYLGYNERKAAEHYFNLKHPGFSLSIDQKRNLQKKFAHQELVRQLGIITGLLTVNVNHRLTPDEAHNIYYMAERKLRPDMTEDFDNPIRHMGRELNFLNRRVQEIPLKIEFPICLIQKAFRKHLTKRVAAACS